MDISKIKVNNTEYNIKEATKVTWDANSNMNNFKTPGVYDIYGERTVKTDNLPITNDGGGHSIAARLTVVASTLQPNNNEICVTQFLQLSNRIGGEGTTYVRTYNENNNGMNGWSPWQKQMGMVETVINSNYETVGQEIFSGSAEKIGEGLNGMINNGMYSGIYIDNISYTGSGNLYYLASMPTFVETFVLIVINDYAATGKLGMQRHVTQLKYAVDAITGESTIQKRLGSGDDYISWGNWEDMNGSKTILWDESSNMNNYKTAGTYEIYGERRNVADNLPVLNSNPGHSIAAKLTVVDSSLRNADGTTPTEICVTQFLMLSNRKGGDGNLYVRTYNENNSPAPEWWTPWQKLQGIREGYIFTDTIQVNPDGGVQDIENVTGLNNMIDNGIYTGIYTNDHTFQAPAFIDTFTLIVINNYAVAGQNNLLKRTISQLKYAVDAITNQTTVKQRSKTDGSDWTEWKDIAGGGEGESTEVDVTDAVKAYGLPVLAAQGYVNDKTLYSAYIDGSGNLPTLDVNDKIKTFLLTKHNGSALLFKFYLEKKTFSESNYVYDIQCYATDTNATWQYYHFVVSSDLSKVSVSESTTAL